MKLLNRRLAATVLFVTVAGLLAGCGSSKSTANSSDPSAGISGNWQMSLVPTNSTDPKSQSGFLLQSGTAVSGSVIVIDTPCSGIATVDGTVSGSDVSLVVTLSGDVINLTGSVSGQNAMSGTYTILSQGCSKTGVSPQTGTWTASEVPPVNGNIQSGTYTSNRMPSPFTGITGQLAQGQNTGISTATLTGTISIPGYCFTSANLAGTISGTSTVLNVLASDGTQLGQITGVVSGNSLSGTMNYVGEGTGGTQGCRDDDAGTITLTVQ